MTQWAIEDGNISEASGTATNILSGLAKVWADFDGTGTVALNDSFNLSSLTDNGTGDYSLDYTNAFSTADYARLFSGSQESVSITVVYGPSVAAAADSVRMRTAITQSLNIDDISNVYYAAHGDLA